MNIHYENSNINITKEILELGKPHIKIIIFLHNVRVAVFSEIAELLHTNRKSYIDSILNELKERDIIEERRAGRRRHVRILYLTDKGEAISNALLRIYKSI